MQSAMSIPWTVVAPATLAGLAYLNARTGFSQDIRVIGSGVKSGIQGTLLEKKDRVNLFYRLEEQAQSTTNADRTFLIYEGRRWTFKETYDIVLQYAAWLKAEHAIGPKEIVALYYMNSPKYLFILFALWSLGAYPALINYNLTSKPLLHCIKVSTARLVFVDDEVREHYSSEVLEALAANNFREGGKGPVQVVLHDNVLEDRVSMIKGAERPPDALRSGAGYKEGDLTACLIYTSGTTGLPKPGIVSWAKYWGSSNGLYYTAGILENDIYYTCMPIYHSTANVLCMGVCLINGTTLALGHRFSNKTFWRDVRESGATVIQYVGETCRYLLAAPPQRDPVTGEDLDQKNNVRVAFGNGMRPDVWQKFKDRFGIETIAEFYGATEAPGASLNISSNDHSRGAIGRQGSLLALMARSTSALVEIDWDAEEPKRDPTTGFCTRVPVNTPGELLFAIDAANMAQKYQGYFRNSKASNSKILRSVFVKDDAWFRSGDVIRTDANGHTWFCDRLGDTFRWRSENVSTNEVSEVLGGHPAVIEANVYGVEVPKHDGRAGCVAIQFNKEIDDDLMDSLAGHATRNLPKYAVPLFLRVMKEMQSTGNNKQQKHGLRLEGVDPKKVAAADRLFWLQSGKYVPYGQADYDAIGAGNVKL